MPKKIKQKQYDATLGIPPDKLIMKLIKRSQRWLRRARRPKYRWIWCMVAVGLYFAILALPLTGFSEAGRKALAIFGVTAFLWSTSALPVAVTGLLVLFLIPFTGVLPPEQTYGYFGNRSVFFILGVFILASPIRRSGLSTRLALTVVSKFGGSQQALIASILMLSAGMSFFLSSHAVAAMLFPVILEVVQAAGAKPGGRFGQSAFLALGWGAGIGGMASLLGGARAALALGLLRETTGQSISFVEWTLWSFPLAIWLLFLGYLQIRNIGEGTAVSMEHAKKLLQARSKRLGKISSRELLTTMVTLLTIFLWIIRGEAWGLDTVAFLGVSLLFVLQIADWQEVEEDVNWGIFVMYGSAIALSAVLNETGASTALAQSLLGWIDSGWLAFGAVALVVILFTEGMSNAATVAMVMPLAIALALNHSIDARAITMGVTIASGLAFMMPVSTPAMAIVIGSGYVQPLQAFQRGFWLKLLGFIGLLMMAKLYWPLFGLEV